jgi:hypothetical protein
MKRWFLKFALSKAGIIMVPILSALVAGALTKIAALSPELAGQVDPREVAGWVWGILLAALSGYALKEQGDGVVKIQAALDMTPVVNHVTKDRYAGPKLYAEVRKAIAVAEHNAIPTDH